MKKLKKFSHYCDSGSNKNTQYYILATSQKQVVELFESVGLLYNLNYVRSYFYQAWGNDGDEIMKDIEITGPCIYAVKRTHCFGPFTDEPKKITE